MFNKGEIQRSTTYKTILEFDRGVTSAVDEIREKEGKKLTLSGICFKMGLSRVGKLEDIAKKGESWREAVERLKLLVQAEQDQLLIEPNTRNSNGARFYLMAAFGYSEKSHLVVDEHKRKTIYMPQKKLAGAAVGYIEEAKKAEEKKKEITANFVRKAIAKRKYGIGAGGEGEKE